ncbi:MAG: carbohydrate-binding family 9-like protein, partial [Planctomycetota bacterium]
MRAPLLLLGAGGLLAACAAPGRGPATGGGARPIDFALPHPRGYVCGRGTPTIDGRLDEPAWAAVPWTEDFVDIQGSPPKSAPRFRTRAKMLWDDDFL